jgi:hypothetical protein
MSWLEGNWLQDGRESSSRTSHDGSLSSRVYWQGGQSRHTWHGGDGGGNGSTVVVPSLPTGIQLFTFSLVGGSRGEHSIGIEGPITNVNRLESAILSIKDLNRDGVDLGSLILETVAAFGDLGSHDSDMTAEELAASTSDDSVVGLEDVIANDEAE